MTGGKKCFLCDQDAVVFVTLIQGNTVKRVGFCTQHAEEQGFLNKPCYQLIDSFPTNAEIVQATAHACPHCHYTTDLFVKNKLMGCGACYEFFAGITDTVLKRLYEIPVHFGKIPKKCLQANSFLPRLDILKKRLNALVAVEHFEQATEVKKQLKKITRQIHTFSKR
jgi:protein arginine kinase activator